MRLGIPKEILEGETRVAASPETVKKFLSRGLEALIEKGAGEASLIPDAEYERAGAKIVPDKQGIYASSDVILKVRHPLYSAAQDETGFIKEKTVLIALLNPFQNLDLLKMLQSKKVTALAMEMIPRIARAQGIDALSSQSNVAGYKAVLMAADRLGRMMPLMMTAAGTITPARVFVIGAGVAGLQAIATARRLGAVVEAFDTRPAVKQEVESIGGKFVSMDLAGEETEGKGGYARSLSQRAHEAEKEFLRKHVAAADIVITTALVPGKPAPRLITDDMVRAMKPGSVIVDLAAEGGGNCDLTERGKEITRHRVRILGHLNLPGLVSFQSSQLYARNIQGLFFECLKDGKLEFNLEDEVIRGALLMREGEIVHPDIRKLLYS